MKNAKMIKVLMALGLGLGLSASANALTPESLCAIWEYQCSMGNASYCSLFTNYCPL
ncbi:MAG: hypothetical protein MJK04_05140 [Psychrosphaera sp.]|nr:hypothetical protein [Psychrosphaera sp.]